FWYRMQEREQASLHQGIELPLLQIVKAFALDELEKQLLWHVLGPELDGRFARVYGYLNDDLTRRRPTLTRLAQLLDTGLDAWSLRQMLAGPRPFARHRLISVHVDHPHGTPATVESVAPAPELVRFLLDRAGDAGICGPGVTLLMPDEVADNA